MAVAFDAKGSASQHNTSTVTSFTYTLLTVGALNNTALAVLLAFGSNVSAVSAHWDSTGANQAMTQIVTANATTNDAYVFLFGLVAPTTGNKTLSVSWTTASDYCVDAISFTGADQTGGVTTFKNTNTAVTSNANPFAITITSPAGDMAVAAWASSTVSLSTAAAGTLIFADNTAVSGAGVYRAGAGSTSLSMNNISGGATQVVIGCDIAAGAAAGRVPYAPWPQAAPVLAQ